jgi:hypothetical protein
MPCLLDLIFKFRIIEAGNSQTVPSTSPPSTLLKIGTVVTVILTIVFKLILVTEFGKHDFVKL